MGRERTESSDGCLELLITCWSFLFGCVCECNAVTVQYSTCTGGGRFKPFHANCNVLFSEMTEWFWQYFVQNQQNFTECWTKRQIRKDIGECKAFKLKASIFFYLMRHKTQRIYYVVRFIFAQQITNKFFRYVFYQNRSYSQRIFAISQRNRHRKF